MIEPFVIYSQNFEDLRAWHALRDVQCPNYLDVGSNHPIELSTTAALYALGWRGILVEPDPSFAEIIAQLRPEDIHFQVLAAEGNGTQSFTVFQNSGLSTANADYANLEAANKRFEKIELIVESRRLDSMLDKIGSSEEIHFMSIDVEGFEIHALRGMALSKYRPWIICVEAVKPGTDEYCGDEVAEYISSKEYLHGLFDGVNDWFVRCDKAELLPLLRLGPSAIDFGKHGWRQATELKNSLEMVALQDRLAQLESRESARMSKLELIFDQMAISGRNRTEILATEVAEPSPKGVLPIEDAFPTRDGLERERFFVQSHSRPIRLLRASLGIGRRGARHPLLVPENHKRFWSWAHNYFSGAYLRDLRADDDVIARLIQGPFRYRHFSKSKVSAGRDRLIDLETRSELHQDFPETLTSLSHQNVLAQTIDDHSTDEWLMRRMDGSNDRFGQLFSDLTTILELKRIESNGRREERSYRHFEGAASKCILFDARSLQSKEYATRGIGLFALAALRSVIQNAEKTVLLTDPTFPPLDSDLTSECEIRHAVSSKSLHEFSAFVNPSPMTGEVGPAMQVLEAGIPSLAIVYDFIPGGFPDVYLQNFSDQARYESQLRALELYSDLLAISEPVRSDIKDWLPKSTARISTAWPESLTKSILASTGGAGALHAQKEPTALIFSADEPRKNFAGGLIGFKRNALQPKVFGYDTNSERAYHTADEIGLPRQRLAVAPFLSVEEKKAELQSAMVTVVPSFAEGLSLPVIESLIAGTPVVASDIPAHRRLLGAGAWLVKSNTAKEWTRAIEKVTLRSRYALDAQRKALLKELPKSLEETVKEFVLLTSTKSPQNSSSSSTGKVFISSKNLKPSLGVVTPWPPQKSGIADYSKSTIPHLGDSFDLTIYSSQSAVVANPHQLRPISDLMTSPQRHDHLLSVIGDSHFHIPIREALKRKGGMVLAHDSRNIYLDVAIGGLQRALHIQGRPSTPEMLALLEEEIASNSFANLGFTELAAESNAMVFHDRAIARRVSKEARIPTDFIPFSPIRRPHTELDYVQIRKSLKLRRSQSSQFNIITIGGVDQRTKLTRQLVESCQWVRSWGYNCTLTFVGHASESETEAIFQQAGARSASWLSITDFVDEGSLEKFLLHADLAIQLRSGDMPMLSAPVFDCAAFGVPTLLTSNLSDAGQLPSYQRTVDDALHPLLMAENISAMIDASDLDGPEIEQERRDFLRQRSPEMYAKKLGQILLSSGGKF